MTKKDMKASLTSQAKADITHCRTPYLNYTSRACEYGNVKYERANYARPMGEHHTTPTAEDFNRLRGYLRAALSHINQTLDAMEYHQADDPDLQDVTGMKAAAYAVDTDEPAPSSPVGPSYLPHLCGACASLNMAITQAARCGLLPADPGVQWKLREKTEARVETTGVSTLLPPLIPESSLRLTEILIGHETSGVCTCKHHIEVHNPSWGGGCLIATCACEKYEGHK